MFGPILLSTRDEKPYWLSSGIITACHRPSRAPFDAIVSSVNEGAKLTVYSMTIRKPVELLPGESLRRRIAEADSGEYAGRSPIRRSPWLLCQTRDGIGW